MASIIFTDRKAAKPNRFLLTPPNGEAYYVTLERADEPVVDGTALNAEILNQLVSLAEKGALAASIESAEHPGCYYREVDGEKEWVNPPALPNTEYRTTERVYGNPVYTMLFYLALYSGSNDVQLPCKTVIKWCGYSTLGGSIPLNDPITQNSLSVEISEYKATIHNTFDSLSREFIYIQVWYTKAEEG